MRLPGWGKVKRACSVVSHRLRTNAVILMYHRIADPSSDPWDIAVRPEHFAEHLEILRRSCTVVTLRELHDDLEAGRLRRSVVVTFDDGYLDNLTCAAPLLQRHGVPATVFMTTRGLHAGGETMWWDVLGAALLHGQPLPPRLELGTGSEAVVWQVPEATTDDLRRWRAEPVSWREHGPPSPRAQLYLQVYRHLAAGAEDVRERRVEQLLEWARAHGLPVRPDAEQRTMTAGEVRALAACAGITIGSHTERHPFLGQVDAERRWREIEGSRRALEAVIDRPVVDFSFPNGDVPPAAVADVRRAGYRTGSTSRSAAVAAGGDLFRLPRLIVRDRDGAGFARWLWRWGHG